jgi:hypothetical protein
MILLPHPIPDSVRHAALLALLCVLLPGCMAPGPVYPAYDTTPGYAMPPVIYAEPPEVISPAFFPGWGYGYWHNNAFFAYRSGCNFYGGRYYGGGNGAPGGSGSPPPAGMPRPVTGTSAPLPVQGNPAAPQLQGHPVASPHAKPPGQPPKNHPGTPPPHSENQKTKGQKKSQD